MNKSKSHKQTNLTLGWGKKHDIAGGAGGAAAVISTFYLLIGGEMSICTILVHVLCNIYQIPLETVVALGNILYHFFPE